MLGQWSFELLNYENTPNKYFLLCEGNENGQWAFDIGY